MGCFGNVFFDLVFYIIVRCYCIDKFIFFDFLFLSDKGQKLNDKVVDLLVQEEC